MTPEQIIELAKRARVSIRGHYDETGSTPAELQRFAELVRNDDREMIECLLSALEYHEEQTRPIHFTTTAIQAAREHLKRMK